MHFAGFGGFVSYILYWYVCPAHQQIQTTYFHATPTKSFRESSPCDRGSTSRKIVKKIYSAEAHGSYCFELALAEATMPVPEASRKGPRKGRHTSNTKKTCLDLGTPTCTLPLASHVVLSKNMFPPLRMRRFPFLTHIFSIFFLKGLKTASDPAVIIPHHPVIYK